MDQLNFDSMLQGVADAFGKNITDATKSQYYNHLGGLNEDQWRRTCETAKTDCEQFPRISEMLKLSYRFAPPDRRHHEEHTISFVCKCRNHWAWINQEEFDSHGSWRCPECHATYDTAFLRQHRDGCLIDLSGDAEDERRQHSVPKLAPSKVVEQLEKQLLF